MEQWLADVIEARHVAELLTGNPQPKIPFVVDPSAASFITLMRRQPWCQVIHADNDVVNGLRETASAMQNGYIKINPKIEQWKLEADGYVWKDEDVPTKENDHYMDATRYFVKTKKILQNRSKYNYLWNGSAFASHKSGIYGLGAI